jgi:hypothetical protein
MTRAALILAFLAMPAHANPVSVSGTTIQLQDTDRPGAIAEVTMHNVLTNGPQDTGVTFTLDHHGLTVEGRFEWNRDGNSDAVHITPPDGIMCVPYDCILTVPEMQTGKLYLFERDKAGM